MIGSRVSFLDHSGPAVAAAAAQQSCPRPSVGGSMQGSVGTEAAIRVRSTAGDRTVRGMRTPTREARLRSLFEEHSIRVFAYSLRHIGSNAAQDVVSDVFLVAWRRIDEVPEDALPWLLVVARNAIGNRRRGLARQQQLADQLAGLDRAGTSASGADEVALERRAMLAALADLSPAEREAVLLTAWDGLSVVQAAGVAGCSRRAFELRLHRARHRLRRLLATDEPHSPGRAAARLEITRETST
jgi:RNA polymerase sigma-70 factor (ECF subfamily)